MAAAAQSDRYRRPRNEPVTRTRESYLSAEPEAEPEPDPVSVYQPVPGSEPAPAVRPQLAIPYWANLHPGAQLPSAFWVGAGHIPPLYGFGYEVSAVLTWYGMSA